MKYIPYDKLSGVPHIVVDGAAQADTVLTLSHWPHSGSPAEFRADTSTEIVLNYLASPGADKRYAPKVRAVTNDHFDEDGLCAMWAMLNPKRALELRDPLVDVAAAGDFHTYRRPQAAKVVFTIRSYADPQHSPVAERLQLEEGACSTCYPALLPLLESFLTDTDRYGPYWSDEWAAMLRSKTLMVTGQVELQEFRAVDLAVVQTPELLHPMVLHNETQRLRILTALPGGQYELRYRYETWVQFASRPVKPRVDLAPLLPRLQEMEQAPVLWTFDGLSQEVPALRPLGADLQPAPSSLKLEKLVNLLTAYYEWGQTKPELQWNPYDEPTVSDQ